MKRWLYLSLVLNGILLAAVAWQRTRVPAMPRAPRGAVNASSTSGLRRMRPRDGGAASATPWAGVDSDDPARFLVNLRALGCPEATIRDLVTLKVCRHYQSQLLALTAEHERAWTPAHHRENKDWREENRARHELRNQMMGELETLFGQPYWPVADGVLGWPDVVDPEFLPLDKRQQVRDVEERYRQLTDDLTRRRSSSGLDAEDTARLAQIEAARRVELKAALSPGEFDEYLVRESPAARYVRDNLPAARSEAEFRAMVKVADEFGMDPAASSGMAARFGMAPLDPAQAEADAKQAAAFQERLKEVLGADRVAEQQVEEQARQAAEQKQEAQRNELAERDRMISIAAEAGVDAESATRFVDRIKELQPALEAKFKEMEAGLTGSADDKDRQMKAAVQSELERIATEVLGDKGKALVEKLTARENSP